MKSITEAQETEKSLLSQWRDKEMWRMGVSGRGLFEKQSEIKSSFETKHKQKALKQSFPDLGRSNGQSESTRQIFFNRDLSLFLNRKHTHSACDVMRDLSKRTSHSQTRVFTMERDKFTKTQIY